MVNLKPTWNPDTVADLGPSWVAFQHFLPNEHLVRTLIYNRIIVVTLIRHPGDTLVSYLHFGRWWPNFEDDAALNLLKDDGGRVGPSAERYVAHYSEGIFVRSRSRLELGAHTLRYEDLLGDPLATLQSLTSRICPVVEDRLRRAVLFCRPDLHCASGEVDPRHVRVGATHQWARELTPPIIALLRTTEPYVTTCRRFGHDWDPDGAQPPYDYSAVDPFRGARRLANRVPITPFLIRAYVDYAPAAVKRHTDPTTIGLGSHWDWLTQPARFATADPNAKDGLLTNLRWIVCQTRDDLRQTFPDLKGGDLERYALWMIETGFSELELPWNIVEPVRRNLIGRLRRGAAAPIM